MPISSRTNNKILPSNSRAVDVARKTLDTLIPIQQRRYANAFEVDSYETVVYTRLRHGTACSCQSQRKVAATLLGQDGKMPPGAMDQILTGGLEFKVNAYGARIPPRPDLRAERGKPEQRNDDEDLFFDRLPNAKSAYAFDIVDDDMDNPSAVTVDPLGSGVNGNAAGPGGTSLDDAVDNFDGEEFLNDTKCGICFGTGFVGGYSVLNGLRIIIDPTNPGVEVSGSIETNRQPYSFMADSVKVSVVLPRGIMGIDAVRVWNNDVPLDNATLKIDNLAYSPQLLMALSDGKAHTFEVLFQDLTYWTHLELQFNMSNKRALFELPRMQEGSNMTLQDAIDDLTINASPSIPSLKREDVLVESTFGKVLIISSSTFWNDSKRNVLGWDVQTRVVQPSELLHALPRRKLTRQKATYLVRDNKDGIRRT